MLVRLNVLQYEKLLVSVEQLFSAKLSPSVDCNCDEALKFPSEKELNAPKVKKIVKKKKTSSADTKGQSGCKNGTASSRLKNWLPVVSEDHKFAPGKVIQGVLDSGFHNQQPRFWITIMVGFRIPQTKITWLPDYLTWGEQIMDKLLMLS